MATFVLVHGAWGGAHTWKLVRPGLQAAGHQVFTPSLTGIGERVHLSGAQVRLSTHVDDVVHHVLYEDLDDLVLLGFSYGGMVVTGALAHLAHRVRELVYLDAFVPDDGQSLVDITGRPPATGLGEPWLIPPRPRVIDDPHESAWNEVRRTPQPIGTFTEPVRLARPLEAFGFGLTYIKALDDPIEPGQRSPFWEAGERARDHDRWRYAEIDTNHMIPQNRPAELVTLLLELAEGHSSQ